MPSLRVLHWAKAQSKPGSIWSTLQPPKQLPAELHAALRRLFSNQQPQGQSRATAGALHLAVTASAMFAGHQHYRGIHEAWW